MDYLDARNPPLPVQDKRDWLDNNLKEKYTWLFTHRNRADRRDPVYDNDGGFHHCGFAAGMLGARFFLQFLGLRARKGTILEWRKWGTIPGQKITIEVKVTDLGGQWVDLNTDTNPAEQDLLARIWRGTSSGIAHLTSNSNHGFQWKDFNQTIDIVVRLLNYRLCKPAKWKADWYGVHHSGQ
jgi:hypothetical protein